MAAPASAAGAGPDWEAVARDYPAARRRTYLDTACKGLPSSAAVRALEAHIADLRDPTSASTTDDTIAMLGQFERARTAAAALLGVAPGLIALVPSTEAGLGAVASGLRLEPGTRVVASDLEFAGTVLPWRFLERHGVELELVPHRRGRIEVADLEAAIDARTRVVVASSVQEVNGFRLDLPALSAVCRSRGVLLVLDAIQHLGPLLLDPAATPVDALAVGGHKWLCAPFGMGFLYLSAQLAAELEPPSRAIMTSAPPAGDWRDYLQDPRRHPGDRLRFPDGAAKVELAALGTTLAAAGLAAAVETLLEIGPAAIARRSADLAAATVAALGQAGAEVVTPRTDPPSPIVTFRSGGDFAQERRLVERMAAAGVLASLRATSGVGGIRLSPYFYNGPDDVDRVAELVADEIRLRRLSMKRGVVSTDG